MVLTLERFQSGEQAEIDREALVTVFTAHAAEFDEIGWATLRTTDEGEAEISVPDFAEVMEAAVYVERLTPGLAAVVFQAATAASLCINVAAVPDAPTLVLSLGDLSDLPPDEDRPPAVVCWSADELLSMLHHAAGSLDELPVLPPHVEHPAETRPVDRADLLRNAFSRLRRP